MITWFLNLNSYFQLGIVFILGFVIGVLLMNIFIIVKNKKINQYQGKLEKESI